MAARRSSSFSILRISENWSCSHPRLFNGKSIGIEIRSAADRDGFILVDAELRADALIQRFGEGEDAIAQVLRGRLGERLDRGCGSLRPSRARIRCEARLRSRSMRLLLKSVS